MRGLELFLPAVTFVLLMVGLELGLKIRDKKGGAANKPKPVTPARPATAGEPVKS